MSTVNQTTAIGIFESRDQAEDAVHDLRQAGFPDDQIGVVTKEGVMADNCLPRR
jgi:Heat induced stress protein YflT domain